MHALGKAACKYIEGGGINFKHSCMHKAKHAANIGVVRIYGEREKAKEWSCMHTEHGWCEKYMERKRREEYGRMHTCRNITWVSM